MKSSINLSFLPKLLISFLFLSGICSAQQLFISKTLLNDSANFDKIISALAKDVSKQYKREGKNLAGPYLFKLNIVSEEYDLALKSIRKSQSRYFADTLDNCFTYFKYRLYCCMQIRKIQQPAITNDMVLSHCFDSIYTSIPEKVRPISTLAFENVDLEKLYDVFQKEIRSVIDIQQDSISASKALKLINTYCEWHIYNQLLHSSLKHLKKIETNKYITEDSVVILTKSGASISLMISRKKGQTTPQPAVVQYSIYPGGDLWSTKIAADRDYVGIVVYTRGKYLSKDSILPYEYDATDAYDIMEWISKQSWCNGKIGMYGGSYLGFSQWATAKKLHPAVKTLVPQVSVGYGIDFPCMNSIFWSYDLRWIHYVTDNKMCNDTSFSNEEKWDQLFTKWYTSGAPFHSLDSINQEKNNYFQRWLSHPSYDHYWKQFVPYQEEFSKINIPILTITGYFDDDQRGAMYYFDQHHRWNKNANHYLFIGPYGHFGAQLFPSPEYMGYTIDPVASVNILDLVYSWFDYTLKSKSRPFLLRDKITYEVMGSNQWKSMPALSKMNNDTILFYLNNIRKENFYQLKKEKPIDDEFIRQQVSYTDRSDTSYSKYLYANNIIDKEIYRNNVLIYATEVLNDSMEINGSYNANLDISINKKDIDLRVELYELMPDGQYFLLSSNVHRASYAKDRSKRNLLIPGKKESIPINNTFFVSKRIKKGSRLVLALSMNKNIYFQLNYGTGKDVSDESIKDGKEDLQIKWFNSSYVKIPVYKY